MKTERDKTMICEMLHTSDEDLLELAAEALWKRDYPNGGSIYKTYESLNFEDKELYRNEVIARAKG